MENNLKFNRSGGTKRILSPSNKMVWFRSKSDKPGAKFDVKIKDVFGETIFERKNFGNENIIAGESVNVPLLERQELDVVVENVRGAEDIELFIN